MSWAGMLINAGTQIASTVASGVQSTNATNDQIAANNRPQPQPQPQTGQPPIDPNSAAALDAARMA